MLQILMAVVCITDDLPEDVDYTKGDNFLRVGVVWLALVRGYPCADPPPPFSFSHPYLVNFYLVHERSWRYYHQQDMYSCF